ncbi:MAG: endo alpha-1,4 polygalactosaminidase [Verrucomicrobiales bacterium]
MLTRHLSAASVLAAAAALHLAGLPCFAAMPDFCIDYRSAPDARDLAPYPMCILHPDAEIDFAAAKAAGQELLAYVSLAEIAADANYAEAARAAGIKTLGENPNWGGQLVEVADPKWAAFLAEQIAKPALERGFDGLFLDTADSVMEVIRKEPVRGGEHKKGLIRAVAALREVAGKDRRILINRGFDFFLQLKPYVDGVLIESVFRTYDPKAKGYAPVAEKDTNWIKAKIAEVRGQRLPVFAVDYVAPGDREGAQDSLAKLKALGCAAYVGPGDLMGPGAASPKPVPRKILVLFGWNPLETERPFLWPADTACAERFQMPLEWLGFEVEYHDVGKGLPPDDASGGYAGIILDAELEIPFPRERWYLDWLLAQREAGVKLLIAGDYPFKQEEVKRLLLNSLGVRGSAENVTGPKGVTILREDKAMLGFETETHALASGMLEAMAPAGVEPILSLTAKDLLGKAVQYDPIYVADWGGALLDPYIGFEANPNVALAYANPFAFLAKVFPSAETFPAPDTTTRDGLRIFYSHIDGDGFTSYSTLKGAQLCSEVVRDRILTQFPFPITVSIVEADVRAQEINLKPDDASKFEAVARSIFDLPNVQAASHAYSHPYIWLPYDHDYEDGAYETRNLVLNSSVDYPAIDVEREIAGSIDYIHTLLPKGKVCDLMLWSGNCRPGYDALAVCEKIGVENMNGGNTIISRRTPCISAIAPRTMQWDGLLQIHASNQNEFVYTNDWRGPFYGGFHGVIETYERTEEPRRLNPVNIYYHFYSAAYLGSLRALEKVHRWCLDQPLHDMTAVEFARLVRDSFGTQIMALGEREWLIANAGKQRTFRIPASLGVPDLARCDGVTGWADDRGWRYIHTAGQRRTIIALGDAPAARPYLRSASQELEFRELSPARLAFAVRGFREAEVEIGGLGGGGWRLEVRAEGAAEPEVRTVRAEGGEKFLKVSLPARCETVLIPNPAG